MARKPTDIAQMNLRLPEDLRRMIEREAKAASRSLNQELVYRLQLSFQTSDFATLVKAAVDGKLQQEIEGKRRWTFDFGPRSKQ